MAAVAVRAGVIRAARAELLRAAHAELLRAGDAELVRAAPAERRRGRGGSDGPRAHRRQGAAAAIPGALTRVLRRRLEAELDLREFRGERRSRRLPGPSAAGHEDLVQLLPLRARGAEPQRAAVPRALRSGPRWRVDRRCQGPAHGQLHGGEAGEGHLRAHGAGDGHVRRGRAGHALHGPLLGRASRSVPRRAAAEAAVAGALRQPLLGRRLAGDVR
mmetsp:Transcript_107610/g.310950  ORF Transcript_107610/g.310950 Transcript_107610/m.310950 type:complete len:217 (+) Transcript_107610:184-834(+)